MPLELFLKDDRVSHQIIVDAATREEDDAFGRIRCPLCSWQPSASSLWCCDCRWTPEPFFQGCRTTWNTFATRGRCPGCGHQWLWTSCLRCDQFSLHEDWYEESSGRAPS